MYFLTALDALAASHRVYAKRAKKIITIAKVLKTCLSQGADDLCLQGFGD